LGWVEYTKKVVCHRRSDRPFDLFGEQGAGPTGDQGWADIFFHRRKKKIVEDRIESLSGSVFFSQLNLSEPGFTTELRRTQRKNCNHQGKEESLF
jgi:hypothetical protein